MRLKYRLRGRPRGDGGDPEIRVTLRVHGYDSTERAEFSRPSNVVDVVRRHGSAGLPSRLPPDARLIRALMDTMSAGN